LGCAERVVAQARNRLAGVMAESVSRLVSLHDVEARPIRKGRLGKPVEFGYKAQIVENVDGVILDHSVEMGNPPDAAQLAPAFQRITARTGRTPPAVTADRGYGQASVERDLHELGVASVAIPRKGKRGAARREFEYGGPSAPRSNGEPDPKAGSATSNEATAGTAPNSPASTEPEPGAGTAYSHTTSSR
jgi:IS5 family transposase